MLFFWTRRFLPPLPGTIFRKYPFQLLLRTLVLFFFGLEVVRGKVLKGAGRFWRSGVTDGVRT